MIAARRTYLLAGAFLAAAVGCGGVVLVRRDSVEDGLPFEGAYVDRSVGDDAVAVSFGESMFDPFRWLNAYLRLGLAVAFLVSALALALVSRLARSDAC